MDDRIAELESRLAQAEKTIALLSASILPSEQPGTAVRAPLRVVDDEGKVLLETFERPGNAYVNEIRLLNRNGERVAALGAQVEGGFLAIRNDAGQLLGYLSSEKYGARLTVDNIDNTQAVVLYGDLEGGAALLINSKTSSIDLGATSESSEITIWKIGPSWDSPGKNMISLTVSMSDERIEIHNQDGEIILSKP